MTPENVLPVLQWLAFVSVGSAIVLGILDGVRQGLAPLPERKP